MKKEILNESEYNYNYVAFDSDIAKDFVMKYVGTYALDAICLLDVV